MFELLSVGAIFFAATVIQTITGFAGNLLAMPGTIQLIGMVDAKIAGALINIFTCLVVALIGWRNIVWKEFWTILILVTPGMLLGFYFFYTLHMDFLLYIYGTVIILIAIKSFFTPAKPRPMPLIVTVIIMTCAGLMQGLFVSGGAFVVLYAVRVFRDKAEFRSTLSLLWTVLNLGILLQCYLANELTYENVTLSLIIVPAVLLAVYLGNILYKHVSGKAFLLMANILLVLSGLSCFLKI